MAESNITLLDLSWSFNSPQGGGSAAADPAKLVHLTIQSMSANNVAMLAESFDLVSGSASGPPIGSGSFQGSGNFFSGCLFVGSVHAAPGVGINKQISVRAVKNTGSVGLAKTIDFEAFQGSIACLQLLLAGATGHRCGFCQSDQPVPVALSLQLDSPVSAGGSADCDRLNLPTTLRHSGDPGFECCWLSQPIDLCSDGADPALWMLRKTDACTWTLVLRRGVSELASYALSAVPGGDCSFPIRLKMTGTGGAECENWPQTVTVSPAP